MSIFVSGTLAYDYIMDFPDAFRNHIMPDALHILNVCFVVDALKKNYGGTGANIAHTMQLLGGEPVLVGCVGSDGDEYVASLAARRVNTKYIRRIPEILTASAHITTDKEDNQITAFFNGPSARAADIHVTDIHDALALALISPTQKDVMLNHARECQEHNIRVVFDPGQQITAFSAQELMRLVGQSEVIIGNDYEIKLLQQKTGWGMKELLQTVSIVITTLGPKGSIISTKDETIEVSPCPPTSVEDPTGAGDAYRAGFFTAFVKGLDLKTCGQVGSVAATYAVERYGTQNHTFTKEEFVARYKECYGTSLAW